MKVRDLETGKIYNSKDIQAVDNLIKLKRENQTNIWVVIDAVVDFWSRRNPKEWQSYLVEIGAERDTRANPKFADNRYSKEKGSGELRFLVDVPHQVIGMVRMLYNVNELPMTKQFWLTFGNRYPVFKIPEKF